MIADLFSDLREGQHNDIIARKMARWHKQQVPGIKKPSLFRTLYKWFDLSNVYRILIYVCSPRILRR